LKQTCGENWWNCKQGILERIGGNLNRKIGEIFWNCEENVLRDFVEM